MVQEMVEGKFFAQSRDIKKNSSLEFFSIFYF